MQYKLDIDKGCIQSRVVVMFRIIFMGHIQNTPEQNPPGQVQEPLTDWG